MTHRFYDVPTVTIIVGENKRSFHIHVDLLCDASSFFKAAFTGAFKESSEKTMYLPEDDEGTFELFVDWLYYQRYEMLPQLEPYDDDDDDSGHDDDDDSGHNDAELWIAKCDERYLQPCRLYVLADKYRIFKLKSLVVERLFAAAAGPNMNGPSCGTLTYASKHTTQGSTLRKLLVDYYTWNIDLDWYEDDHIEAFLRENTDIATDLLLNFAKHLKGKEKVYNPFVGDMPEEYKDKESGQEI